MVHIDRRATYLWRRTGRVYDLSFMQLPIEFTGVFLDKGVYFQMLIENVYLRLVVCMGYPIFSFGCLV